MEKSFRCPKCKSLKVEIALADGTLLKSVRKKLKIEKLFSDDKTVFDGCEVICHDCNLTFYPKYLNTNDVFSSDQPNTEILSLEPFNSSWADKFADENAVIIAKCGDYIHAFHHVGSTSVEGMCAKPIIDMAIEINDFPPTDQLLSELILLGYNNRGECDVPGRVWLTKGCPRSFHLHLTPIGGEVMKKQVKFRDELRKSKDFQQEYLDIKKPFHNKSPLESHEYNIAKNKFVQKLLEL